MAMFRKALTATVIAVALAAVPPSLSAQEKGAATAERVSVLEWVSGIWNGLASWLAGGVITPTGSGGGGATTQGSCAVDPFGCPDNG